MVFVPAANVLMVENRATYLGQQCECVLYFQHVGAITAAAADDILEYMEIDLLPEIAVQQHNAWSWNEAYGTDLTTQFSPTYTRTFAPPVTGAIGVSPGMPGNIACCISFRTNGRGRSSRGRNYVGGLPESHVSSNDVAAAFINACIGAYEDMLSGGTLPANWTWVVLSRVTNGAPRASGLVQPITAVISTDTTVDSQRGRLR